MVFSRSLRRFVAGTVAVLFLGCQGMTIAHARVIDSQQAGTTQGSCHDPAQQSDNGARKADCASQLTFTQSGAAVFAAVDLPAIPTRISRLATVASQASPGELPLLRVKPPPLAILYCCLRN